jgi:signal transduction histidine kinase
MTIRGRVTLWYSLVLYVSFLLTAGGMYYELIYERDLYHRRHEPEHPVEEEVGEVLGYYIFPALVLTVVGGWFLLRRSLAPLNQLTRAAERLNAENIQEALPRSFNGDEVDRLSEVLNAMNQRLSAAMTEIHEFMLHASHELRTPLTILHSEIETSLGRTQSTEEKERLGGQLDEIQRLTQIVESLALLARSNSGQMKYVQEPVPFHQLIQDAAEDACALGRSKQLRVEVKQMDEVWVLGDRDRLRQMVLNLVENACKYNKPQGSIVVAGNVDDSLVTLEIRNTGDGIRPGDLPHVFKKFYRGSSDSIKDPGGSGLGLSIAQSIVKAHGGNIAIDVSLSDWTVVRTTLPRLSASKMQYLT